MSEQTFLDREGPRDECGVFGVYAPGHDVSRLAYFGLYALQHRGQESAGIATCEGGHITTMRDSGLAPDAFFHRHRFGRHATGDFAAALTGFAPAGQDHDLWQDDAPPSLVVGNVEAIWSAIDQHDDWAPLGETIAAIRRLGEALGPPPAVMV